MKKLPLFIPIVVLAATAATCAAECDKECPTKNAMQKAADATSAKDPSSTCEALANTYTELAGILPEIKNAEQANEHAAHVGLLVKQIIVLDKQWDAMKDMLSGDAESRIENTYGKKIDTHKDKAENEAKRLKDANYFGSVELRRAMTGFED